MRYEITCPRSEFSISPVAIGYSSDMSVTSYGPAVRQQYIIHYVINGRGYFNGNPVCKGQGFLIKPGMFEKYYADREEPWTFLWVVAYGDDMEKVFRAYGADKESMIFEYGFADELESELEFIRIHSGESAGICEMLSLFWNIVKLFESSEKGTGNVKNSKIYLEYAAEMISRKFSRNITVREICEKLGVSEPYLFRIFKSEYGKSPKRYISDFRIAQSKLLLTRTDMKIGEVGSAVGFDDVLAFSKFFSKETGMSPSAYRSENMR